MSQEIIAFFQNLNISLLVKIPLLVFIFLFFLFTLILLNQKRALTRIIHIESNSATALIQTVLIMYAVLVFSLFLLALVIL